MLQLRIEPAVLLLVVVHGACSSAPRPCVDDRTTELETLEAERDPGNVPDELNVLETDEESWQKDPAEHAIRFLAVGDTGTGDRGQWTVGQAMAEACRSRYRPECNFVLVLGDNFYPNGLPAGDRALRDRLWKERFTGPYADLSLKFYAITGNHDYGGGSGMLAVFGEAGLERAELQLNRTPGTPPCDVLDGPGWCMPSLAYNFEVPFARGLSATLVALDTTAALFGDANETQLDGLKRALARQAHWRFVFGHHTYRSSGYHGSRNDQGGLGRLLRAAASGSDLVLTGHDHHLEFRVPEGDDDAAVIVSGAGAKLHLAATLRDDTVEAIYNGRGFFDIIASEQYLEVMLVGLEPLARAAGASAGAEPCRESPAATRAEFAWCKKHGDRAWKRGFCPKADFW